MSIVRLHGILSERANATDQTQEHLFWCLWRSSDVPNVATFEELYAIYRPVFNQSPRALRRMLAGNAVHWRVVQSRRRGTCYTLTGASEVAHALCVPLESTGTRYVRDAIDVRVSDIVGDLAHRRSIMLLPSILRGTDDPRSQALIGKQNGCSRATVVKRIKRLVDHGLVSVVRNEIVVAEASTHAEAMKIKHGLAYAHVGRIFFIRLGHNAYVVCTTTCNEYMATGLVGAASARAVKRVRARLRSIERKLDQPRCAIQGEHAPRRSRSTMYERNDKAKARRQRSEKRLPQKTHTTSVIVNEGTRRFTHAVECPREHAAWHDGMVVNA